MYEARITVKTSVNLPILGARPWLNAPSTVEILTQVTVESSRSVSASFSFSFNWNRKPEKHSKILALNNWREQRVRC